MPFQYAAKVICGLNKKEGMIAHGVYETVVNIHNPDREVQKIKFKVAVAGEAKDGTISGFTTDVPIKGDAAQFYGCTEFHKFSGVPAATLIDGFFVIESPKSLDVVAVYTTNDVDGKGVPAIAVERVFERTIP
jgi:hypothetical protein